MLAPSFQLSFLFMHSPNLMYTLPASAMTKLFFHLEEAKVHLCGDPHDVAKQILRLSIQHQSHSCCHVHCCGKCSDCVSMVKKKVLHLWGLSVDMQQFKQSIQEKFCNRHFMVVTNHQAGNDHCPPDDHDWLLP